MGDGGDESNESTDWGPHNPTPENPGGNYTWAELFGSEPTDVNNQNNLAAPMNNNITVENILSPDQRDARAAHEYTRNMLEQEIKEMPGGSYAQTDADVFRERGFDPNPPQRADEISRGRSDSYGGREMRGPPSVMSGGRYNRAGLDLTDGANWGGNRYTYNQQEPIPFSQAVSEDFMRIFDHLPGLIPGVNIQDMNYSNRTDDTGQQLAAPPTTDPWSFSQALADSLGYGTGLPIGSAFEFARNQQTGNPLDYTPQVELGPQGRRLNIQRWMPGQGREQDSDDPRYQ